MMAPLKMDRVRHCSCGRGVVCDSAEVCNCCREDAFRRMRRMDAEETDLKAARVIAPMVYLSEGKLK